MAYNMVEVTGYTPFRLIISGYHQVKPIISSFQLLISYWVRLDIKGNIEIKKSGIRLTFFGLCQNHIFRLLLIFDLDLYRYLACPKALNTNRASAVIYYLNKPYDQFIVGQRDLLVEWQDYFLPEISRLASRLT